jgi:hypothetical protein
MTTCTSQALGTVPWGALGGALCISSQSFTIRNSRIYKNLILINGATGSGKQTAQGGGIYIAFATRGADISGSNITYNRIVSPTSLGSATSTFVVSGGGIAATWNSVLRINSSVVAYNRIEATGAITQGKGNATGGGVFFTTTLLAKSSRFYGNSIISNYTASGGGIGGTGAAATLWGCSVFSNSITGQQHT